MLTEKAMTLRDRSVNPEYVFEVARSANKIEIARAVEAIFNVEVAKVNTVLMKGKLRRQGRFAGRSSNWKKAYVILKEGQKLGDL
jgi:large subunit ribosomal protein L23